MNLGDCVKVKEPVVFYHHPLHRNTGFNAQGLEGVVVAILRDYRGRPISANFPIQVEFQVAGAKRPFRAHLRDSELIWM
ncbi:MAG: ferredoxin-thioredoxin reductase variable chain [Nodosilinea sp. LVE1205-7]|jgi:hypothetical protein